MIRGQEGSLPVLPVWSPGSHVVHFLRPSQDGIFLAFTYGLRSAVTG